MKIADDQLELLGKRFVNSQMQRRLGITFEQYAVLSQRYDDMIIKVMQRSHGINITDGIARLVAV